MSLCVCVRAKVCSLVSECCLWPCKLPFGVCLHRCDAGLRLGLWFWVKGAEVRLGNLVTVIFFVLGVVAQARFSRIT
jgi:hypothetical protein